MWSGFRFSNLYSHVHIRISSGMYQLTAFTTAKHLQLVGEIPSIASYIDGFRNIQAYIYNLMQVPVSNVYKIACIMYYEFIAYFMLIEKARCQNQIFVMQR